MSNRSVPIIRLFQPSAIAKVTALWHTNHGLTLSDIGLSGINTNAYSLRLHTH